MSAPFKRIILLSHLRANRIERELVQDGISTNLGVNNPKQLKKLAKKLK